MVDCSDEYCSRCDENRAVHEVEYRTYTEWRCLECGHVVHVETKDDDDVWDIF